jgi:hypothetical protein
MSVDTMASAAADAVTAPLDLLPTDAAQCPAAPDEPGGGGLAPLCDAPGTYVYDR